MRIENCRVVVDSYAWIEYFSGSKAGELVKEYLISASSAYTPSIVLAEIARKYMREGNRLQHCS
ncbi:MAG TPA: type II toxin-antitoxin system VapC family toxin [Thermodesulfobacteriaceae bacterium]|nr:type II toxin-antitoxin system VapC family toxin [Thermodesulfobacteriaceae bacterium]